MSPAKPPPRPGRPPACPLEVVLQVVRLRQQGFSYGAICNILNAADLPTPAGRPRWQRSYVDRLLHTRYATEILHANKAVGGRKAARAPISPGSRP